MEKEIEEEFIEILESGKDLTSEDVWTDLEKIQWLRKSMTKLTDEYKQSLRDKINERKGQLIMKWDNDKAKSQAYDDVLFNLI